MSQTKSFLNPIDATETLSNFETELHLLINKYAGKTIISGIVGVMSLTLFEIQQSFIEAHHESSRNI